MRIRPIALLTHGLWQGKILYHVYTRTGLRRTHRHSLRSRSISCVLFLSSVSSLSCCTMFLSGSLITSFRLLSGLLGFVSC
ncbi:hypothetical protein BD309DRAFT_949583, partial [Dichomitus squalens]